MKINCYILLGLLFALLTSSVSMADEAQEKTDVHGTNPVLDGGYGGPGGFGGVGGSGNICRFGCCGARRGGFCERCCLAAKTATTKQETGEVQFDGGYGGGGYGGGGYGGGGFGGGNFCRFGCCGPRYGGFCQRCCMAFP